MTQILDCIKSAIGVRGCKYKPNIYLNSLPGISIKSLDMIANEDQGNYMNVISDIIERAAMRMSNDFAAGAGISLEITTSGTDTYCVGRIVEPIRIVPKTVAPTEQGILFTFKQSKYLVMNLLSIRFRSTEEKTVTFYVRDAVTNDIYDEITAGLVVGENLIPVNQQYFPRRHSNKLFLFYYSNELDYYETNDHNCHDDCSTAVDTCHTEGANELIKGTGKTYGLSVDFMLECSIQKLLCGNIGALGNALLYAAGIEYIYEVIGSSRLNWFTTTTKERNNELLELFEKRYKEAMKSGIKTMNFCDDCCFSCEGGVTYKYVCP